MFLISFVSLPALLVNGFCVVFYLDIDGEAAAFVSSFPFFSLNHLVLNLILYHFLVLRRGYIYTINPKHLRQCSHVFSMQNSHCVNG